MNSSGYVGHVTSLYLVEYSPYCVLFSSRVRVRIRTKIRFSLWLVGCCATLGCNCHGPVKPFSGSKAKGDELF